MQSLDEAQLRRSRRMLFCWIVFFSAGVGVLSLLQIVVGRHTRPYHYSFDAGTRSAILLMYSFLLFRWPVQVDRQLYFIKGYLVLKTFN